MSVSCDETDLTIQRGTLLYAGTRSDVDFYSYLSDEVIRRIPPKLRRSKPCVPGDGGVDIHATMSKWVTISGQPKCVWVELREFAFSISRKTARKYIPKHYRRYPPPQKDR